jgi:hypothetical protein
MGEDGRGWERMGEDGRGWERMGEDGRGWKRMGESDNIEETVETCAVPCRAVLTLTRHICSKSSRGMVARDAKSCMIAALAMTWSRQQSPSSGPAYNMRDCDIARTTHNVQLGHSVLRLELVDRGLRVGRDTRIELDHDDFGAFAGLHRGHGRGVTKRHYDGVVRQRRIRLGETEADAMVQCQHGVDEVSGSQSAVELTPCWHQRSARW